MSEYIASQNNVVGAKFGEALLMKTTQLTSTGYPYEYEPFADGSHSRTYAPGRRSTVVKERIIGLEPEAVQTGEFRSILGDTFKASILTALGIQRIRR